jgi:hypothetical protein
MLYLRAKSFNHQLQLLVNLRVKEVIFMCSIYSIIAAIAVEISAGYMLVFYNLHGDENWSSLRLSIVIVICLLLLKRHSTLWTLACSTIFLYFRRSLAAARPFLIPFS